MNIEKKRKVRVQMILVTLVVLLLLIVGPSGIVKHKIISASENNATEQLVEFGTQDKLLQTYTPQCDYLEEIHLYMQWQEAQPEEQLTFVLYDKAYAPIYQRTFRPDELNGKEYLRIPTELSLLPGEVCYYEVLVPENNQSKIELVIGNREEMGQVENGILFSAGKPENTLALKAEYIYKQPLSMLRLLTYFALILFAGALYYWGTERLRQQFPGKMIIFEKCIRGIVGLLVITGMAAALYFAVALNYFGGVLLDQMTYAMGILVAGAWALYALFHKKSVYIATIAPTTAIDMWKDYLQTICFAGVIYANCMYANATEMKLQYENTRWMLIFLGLALLLMTKSRVKMKKDLIRVIIEAVFLAGSILYALFYIRGYREDAGAYYLAKLYMAVFVIWGFLIINTIAGVFSIKWKTIFEKISRMQWIQIGLTVAFCIGLLCFRNEKIWPFEIIVPALVYLLQGNEELQKEKFLKNLSNGVLLAFVLITIKALLHRPFMKWMFYRYPGYFHTVACTGMFLTVVFCVALVKFYQKANGSKHIFRDTWKELFFCALSMIYVFLTMSRTALLAIGILYICVIFLTAFVYKKKWKQILLELALVMGITAISFPMVYSATRMVPAIVRQPYHFEPVEPSVEEYSAMLTAEDEPDSDKYMSMERFSTLFFARVKLPRFLFEQTNRITGQTALQQKTVNNDTDAIEKKTTADLESEENQTVESKTMLENAREGSTDTSEDISEEASTEEATDEDTFEVAKGLTNGRMDIYKTYLAHLTWNGHPKMGYKSEDGTIDYGHAHNSYLQVAYDFGIPMGILFLLLCLISFINAISAMMCNGNKNEYNLLLFGFITIFGIVSVTEWAFHPSIPVGFTFIWAFVLLMNSSINKKTRK